MARDHATRIRKWAHGTPGSGGGWWGSKGTLLGVALVTMVGVHPAGDTATTATATGNVASDASNGGGAVMDVLVDGVRSFGAATADALQLPDEARVRSFVNGRPLR